MKKITLILSLMLVLVGCSTQKKLTVDSIQSVSSKEELAKVLNCDSGDLKQIITNINNIYDTLPESTEPSKVDNTVRYTADGEIVISKEELMSYIEKIEVTTDNWKDFFGVQKYTREKKNDFGDVIAEYEEVIFDLNPDLIESYADEVVLQLHDNVNNVDVISTKLDIGIYEGGYYHGDFNIGDIVYIDDYNDWKSYIFDINNFTCTRAKGYLYKTSFPEEIIYIDEDDSKYVNYYDSKYGIYGTVWLDSGYDSGYVVDSLFEEVH